MRICLLLVLTIQVNFANCQFIDRLKSKFDTFTTQNWQEKVYVHTDKNLYAVGETIWFRTYLVEAYSLKSELAISSIVHVELISPGGDILVSRMIHTTATAGAGDILLSPDSIGTNLSTGKYRIRAYTNLQLNSGPPFFEKEIQIISRTSPPASPEHSRDSLILQFFPEGGELVNNIGSQVAFKAANPSGGVMVKGEVRDDNGTTVGWFQSFHNGMGFFQLTPLPGRSYFARVNDRDYPIPAALSRGYTLQLSTHKKGYITLVANSTLTRGLEGVVLVGQARGKIFYAQELTDRETKFAGNIPGTGLPPGVIQFTLFDEKGIPQCERLVFMQNPRFELDVAVSTDKQVYQPRSSVVLTLDTDYIMANMSLSVTDMELVSNDSTTGNIFTHLLLTSDLKGHIEDPAYYFLPGTPPIYLDLVMLTHGYRRFTWKEVDKWNNPLPEYYPERGFNISGILTDEYNQGKPVVGEVSLTVMPDLIDVQKVRTNNSGRFIFMGNDFFQESNLFLQAKKLTVKKSGKTKPSDNVVINLDEYKVPEVESLPAESFSQPATPANFNRYLASIDLGIQRDNTTILLDEVEVKAKRPDPFAEYDAYGGMPSSRLVMDSLGVDALVATNIAQLLQGRVAGVQVNGTSISIRGAAASLGSGGTGPLFLLDNMPVDSQTIMSFPPHMVHSIAIYKGPETAFWGARGANGVIIVHTKKGEDFLQPDKPSYNIKNLTHPGYYRAREFYSPAYDGKQIGKKRDNRVTLHWEPNIQPDSTGTARIRFFTGDNESIYRIEVEGITPKGQIIREERYFRCEEGVILEDQ